MIARARTEEGFGLIELMISLVVLNVGILAILAAFSSGSLTIQRASETSSATVLGDKQLELYRGLLYAEIALDTDLVAAANTDAVYQCDGANKVAASGACGGANQQTQFTKTCTPMKTQCDPHRTVTGPDGRSYRVDTYIVAHTPPLGQEVKLVSVVVRRGDTLTPLARLSSTFDRSGDT